MKKNNSMFKLCLLCLMFLTCTSSSASSTLERIQKTKTVNLGYRDSAVPFSFLDSNKQPIGYSIDLCKRLVETLKINLKLPDIKINWVLVQSNERLSFLLDEKIDIECGNTTATAERRKTVDFTIPIFIAGSGVLVRSESQISTLQALTGKKITIIAGSTGEKIVKRANESGRNLIAVPVKTNAEAFSALDLGQVDAWITDDILLSAFRAQHSDPKKFLLLEKRHTIEPLSLMYRKSDLEFSKVIDRELVNLINKNAIQKLYQTWFTQPIEPKGVNLDTPASRYLKETWKIPTKIQADIDAILF